MKDASSVRFGVARGGVVSTGVNFFNPGAQTAVFAKLDVTIGDDVTGIGAKAGMRHNW